MNLEEYIKLYKNGGYIKEMRKYVELEAPECSLDDLEILTWDIVKDYVDKAREICLQEMRAILDGKDGIDPLKMFVPIAHRTGK